jgi:guanylate kinase
MLMPCETVQRADLETLPIQVHNLAEIYSRQYPRVTDIWTRLLVLDAVSGVGRSTVGKLVQQQMGKNVGILRNFTTRGPRCEDEKDRLIFGSRADLASQMVEGEVLFYVNWEGNGQQYALLRNEVTRMATFDTGILETTHFGWPLKAQNPRLVTNVWLTCVDPGTIERHLAERGTECRAEREQRLRSALDEQAYILAKKDELIRLGKVDAVIEVDNLAPGDVANAVLRVIQRQLDAVV